VSDRSHCWHMRSGEVLPGKTRMVLTRERCCWCGFTRARTHKSAPDHSHGPHEKNARRSVDVDTDEAPECVERVLASVEKGGGE
jgi:hypothetical protein